MDFTLPPESSATRPPSAPVEEVAIDETHKAEIRRKAVASFDENHPAV